MKCHVVFCPEYRRSVLTPRVDSRLKDVYYEVAHEDGITFPSMAQTKPAAPAFRSHSRHPVAIAARNHAFSGRPSAWL
ncbi:MAG TPA: transposase [Xanthobacteraceae bacterium]